MHITKFKPPITYFILLSILLSCSNLQKTGDTAHEPLRNLQQFDFSNAKKLKEKIDGLGSLKERVNQEKLVNILIAFHKLTKDLKTDEIQILPNSQVKFKLSSFCASPSKAIPVEKEVFKWTKGSPNISLVKPVTKLYSTSSKKNQNTFQEIIWNLANRTYYEDYPDHLKDILNQASSSSQLVLPSRLKSNVLKEIVPDEISNSIDLLEGEYHTLKDFKSALQSKRSKNPLPQNYFVSTIPDSSLLSSTESTDYDTQIITLYNPTNKTETIKISDYYLQPVREDVQPIILASVIPNLEEIKKLLDQISNTALALLGVQYPTLSDAEIELIKQKPQQALTVYRKKVIAEDEAAIRYPNSKGNGDMDAFRHFVWAGLLTRDLDEDTARKFLNAHENAKDQPLNEKLMDTHNNEQGIIAAKDLLKNGQFQDKELFEAAKDAVDNQKLKVLNNIPRHKNDY